MQYFGEFIVSTSIFVGPPNASFSLSLAEPFHDIFVRQVRHSDNRNAEGGGYRTSNYGLVMHNYNFPK